MLKLITMRNRSRIFVSSILLIFILYQPSIFALKDTVYSGIAIKIGSNEDLAHVFQSYLRYNQKIVEQGLKEVESKLPDLVEINPSDATTLGLTDGEMVWVVSRRGRVMVKAKITEATPQRVVSMSGHFAESPINLLTNPAVDPIAKTPGLKVCAVRIEKEGS